MSQGKSKTMPMQTFLGVEAVYYGIVQVENRLLNHLRWVRFKSLLFERKSELIKPSCGSRGFQPSSVGEDMGVAWNSIYIYFEILT